MKNLKGFTLVEVLIVIIIIGILVAALLPRLTGSQQRARDVARTGGVSQVSQAVALMMSDVGPLSTVGSICANAFTTVSGSLNGSTVTLANYLSSLPVDPQSTHQNTSTTLATCTGAYAIEVATDGQSAIVYADLESTNGANLADIAATDDTLAEFQTVMTAGGSVRYGILVR